MLLETIESILASKEKQIRSKTAKALATLGPVAFSLLSLWLAPTPSLKLALLLIGILSWTVLWLVARVAVHRSEIQKLNSEISALRGSELTTDDLTVLRCVFEPYPDRYEKDEIVGKTGLGMRSVSLSLRRLKGAGYIDKSIIRRLRSGNGINPNGYWITETGEAIIKANGGEQDAAGQQQGRHCSIVTHG